MQKQQRYEVIGVAQGLAINYTYAPARKFLAHFRQCVLRPEAESACGEHLRRLLREQLHDAYFGNRVDSLHTLQVSLNEILSRRFSRTGDHVERSPFMFEMQQQIIEAQLRTDLQGIAGESMPESADAFKRWFDDRARPSIYPVHPLFDFIEEHASFEQFRRFIAVEAGVHVSFDDVIALAQVGVRGSVKSEFLRNLRDEAGDDDPERFHLSMFEHLVGGLGIGPIYRCTLPSAALACGSYMMFLAHFRNYYGYCVGYLGILEALTPARFGCIARGGARLGIASELLEYHTEHSVLDTDHAHGWLHNIILPTILEHGAQMSREIAIGVRLRERVAQRYWDAMLAELTTHPQLTWGQG